MLPLSPIESYKIVDYFIDFESETRHFIGLFKTQDGFSYMIECKFVSNKFPQSIKDWESIENNVVSVKKIFIIDECPVCFDSVETSEISVMECAHCVCSKCHQKLKDCPMCKSKSVAVITKLTNSLIPSESSTLLSSSDLLGYKVVGVVIQQNPSALVKLRTNQILVGDKLNSGVMLTKVSALLSLQIEAKNALVYAVEQGSGIVAFNKLKPSVKYCTNQVRVISARFIGEEKQIKQSLMAYQTGNARFVSYHDKKTEYRLNKNERVETAGQGCGNSRCGQGLYFFTDVPSVLKFWGERNQCVKSKEPSSPWISDSIVLSNGFHAIKLDKNHKNEQKLDNYLTNQRQLQEWCDKLGVKHINDTIQII